MHPIHHPPTTPPLAPAGMTIDAAQREMRTAFLGGFGGQFVAGLIWLVAAALGSWFAPAYGMATLFFGSMAIFPLTQLVVRLLGRPGAVSPTNGLWALGAQTAFIVPPSFLLVGAATLYQTHWFFPAAMIVVGVHYLPFITLYGMRMFGALAMVLVVAGAGLGLYGPPLFSLGGWVTGAVLLGFAFLGRHFVLQEERQG
ncbi:MAG: hypothetical protein EI684_15485 [Candidatus Viridilinea halotolerans]|uniref:Uncharacterized protein n=1 Tax=Candidatus Viridilinea halotolerans TaxID=2491704 RepID=A0A426TVJ9_9CHLR|nr:MAG: hypothetical protein EI684_15485 [Candidatus Viridilinea halotolerans]